MRDFSRNRISTKHFPKYRSEKHGPCSMSLFAYWWLIGGIHLSSGCTWLVSQLLVCTSHHSHSSLPCTDVEVKRANIFLVQDMLSKNNCLIGHHPKIDLGIYRIQNCLALNFHTPLVRWAPIKEKSPQLCDSHRKIYLRFYFNPVLHSHDSQNVPREIL